MESKLECGWCIIQCVTPGQDMECMHTSQCMWTTLLEGTTLTYVNSTPGSGVGCTHACQQKRYLHVGQMGFCIQ